MPRRRVGGEQSLALLEGGGRVALDTDEQLLGVVEHVGHRRSTLFVGVDASRTTLPLWLSRPQLLSPLVLEGDGFNRKPGDRTELADRVTDRNEGKGLDIVWHTEDCIHFLLKHQMPRGQGGAKSKRTRGQQHVLHGGVYCRAGDFREPRGERDVSDQATAYQYRRFTQVFREIHHRIQHAIFLLLRFARRGGISTVAGQRLIHGLFIA